MSPTPSESYVVTEEPDLLIGHYIGRVTVDDVLRIYDVQVRFCEGKRHIFLLIDVSRLVHIPADARRVAAEGPGGKGEVVPILGTAFVGASFQQRILGSLVVRAARLLRPSTNYPIRFFDSHAQARVWFAELRPAVG